MRDLPRRPAPHRRAALPLRFFVPVLAAAGAAFSVMCGGPAATTPTPSGCIDAISPIAATISPDSQTVTATITAGPGCSWSAVSSSPFLTISGASNGTGNGALSVSVSENTGAQRTGVVTAASRNLTITQAAARTAIIDITGGITGTTGYPGQSFTTPPGKALRFVRFNWYQRTLVATAFGTAFLLDREYLGTPAGLSATVPGFIASAAATGDALRFSEDVSLSPSTRYWIYANVQGDFSGDFDSNTYSGGDAYSAALMNRNFSKAEAFSVSTGPNPNVNIDWNFRLLATPQ